MRTVLLVLLCVLLNAVAQLALKAGASTQSSALSVEAGNLQAWSAMLTSKPVLLGIVLWTLSTLVWLYVLSQNSLVFAYGLYGLNYLLVPLLAHWRLSEPLSGLQIVGMGLIALGVGCTVAGR